MNRRRFLALLASIPLVGRFVPKPMQCVTLEVTPLHADAVEKWVASEFLTLMQPITQVFNLPPHKFKP